jgi:hypothetical protein
MSRQEWKIFINAFLVGAIIALFAHIAFAGVAEDLHDNTVIVTDGYGHGSGVMFKNKDRVFVWTAGHVADIFMRPDGTYSPVLITQGDKSARARVLRGGDVLYDMDFALLEIFESEGDDGWWKQKGSTEFYRAFDCIKLGQEIIHCGTPYDRSWNERLVFFGRISAVRQRCAPVFGLTATERFLDHVDLTAGGGCSGGPVVDRKTGGIVGLLVMGLRNGHRLNIIEPTRRLYRWAARHDCLWAVDREVPLPASLAPWPADSYIRECEDRVGDWDGQPKEPVLPKILSAVKYAITRQFLSEAA